MGDVRWNETDESAERVAGRDKVRWGPILAGVLTALTTMLLLGLAGLAGGLTAFDASQANNENAAADAGRNTLLWSAISAVIAFTLGGWVASKAADIRDRQWGAVHGALVFLTALPIMLWLAAQGAGAALGAIGDLRDVTNTAVTGGADVDREQIATSVRNAATGAVVGSLLGLIASAVGGMLGAPEEGQSVGERERERDRSHRASRSATRSARS